MQMKVLQRYLKRNENDTSNSHLRSLNKDHTFTHLQYNLEAYLISYCKYLNTCIFCMYAEVVCFVHIL